MKIDIASVFKNEGAVLDVSGEVEAGTPKYLGSSFEFSEPLKVEASIRNIGGALEIKGRLGGKYISLCSRCGAPVEGALEVGFDETVGSGYEGGFESSDSECFSLVGTVLDISGLINALIWGNLPMKPLCREDCKGLCSVCGCNLNESVCDCDTRFYDPRLAILRGQSEK